MKFLLWQITHQHGAAMAVCPCREATAHVHAEILLLAAEISASFLQCSNFTAGGGGSAAAKDEACTRVGFKH